MELERADMMDILLCIVHDRHFCYSSLADQLNKFLCAYK